MKMHVRVRLGFSLIEILVVIAIIAVLMGLLLPAIQKTRQAFRKLESKNNMKQMALAIHSYHDVNKILPPSCGWNNPSNKAVENGTNGTVFFAILPYMEYDNFYQMFYGQLDKRCSNSAPPDPKNDLIGVSAYRANRIGYVIGAAGPLYNKFKNPKQFTTILDKSTAPGGLMTVTSYLANKDLLDRRLSINLVTDGSSNTMLFAEGIKSCSGNVYDNLNVNVPSLYYSNYCDGSWSYAVSRVNNWAVGSEAYDGGTNIKTYATPSDTSQGKSFFAVVPPATATEINIRMEYQATGQLSPGQQAPCSYNWGCPGTNPDQGVAKGNIPVFFKQDPYFTPWYSYTYVASGSTWVETPTRQTAKSATFQDLSATNVSGSGSIQASSTPPQDCLWFAPQAFVGNLNVAMADGSVHSISSQVSQASWDAAITPDGNDVVGADFFD